MAVTIQDYEEAAGPAVIEELRALADFVRGRRMRHINSTSVGGGVAEILTRMIPLLRDLGIDARWDVI
jgi:trehalose synthase